MTVSHLKKLSGIQEKIKSLRDQEEKIQQELMESLSQCLISARAFDIDFDTLLGSILEVIDKIETTSDQKKEDWKKSGRTFRQSRKNILHSLSKTKEATSDSD